MFTGGLTAAVMWPARSETLAATVSCSPSPVTTLSDGHAPSTPEWTSSHDHATLASSRYQPAGLGAARTDPASTGATVSMRTSNDPAAQLPAASQTSPDEYR